MKQYVISRLNTAVTRFETNQLAETFLINLLKDEIRFAWEHYSEASDKDGYCVYLLRAGVSDLREEAAKSALIWEYPATVFGAGKRLLPFGKYLANVIEGYYECSPAELLSIVTAARAKVDE